MAFVKVATLEDLKTNPLIEVIVSGNPYALCRFEGGIHALNGLCPHQGGPLGQGELNGAMVTCPWHAFEFDCRTGKNDWDESVETYPVKVDGVDIFIDLPTEALA